jgi:hypothetical protein
MGVCGQRWSDIISVLAIGNNLDLFVCGHNRLVLAWYLYVILTLNDISLWSVGPQLLHLGLSQYVGFFLCVGSSNDDFFVLWLRGGGQN